PTPSNTAAAPSTSPPTSATTPSTCASPTPCAPPRAAPPPLAHRTRQEAGWTARTPPPPSAHGTRQDQTETPAPWAHRTIAEVQGWTDRTPLPPPSAHRTTGEEEGWTGYGRGSGCCGVRSRRGPAVTGGRWPRGCRYG